MSSYTDSSDKNSETSRLSADDGQEEGAKCLGFDDVEEDQLSCYKLEPTTSSSSCKLTIASIGSSEYDKFADSGFDLGEGKVETASDVEGAGSHSVFRAHASSCFPKIDFAFAQQSLAGLTVKEQEDILTTELLYVLVGTRGAFLEPWDNMLDDDFMLTFNISDTIHLSLRKLLEKILPLVSYYNCMQKFIERAQRDDAGPVMEALSSSLTNIVNDYYVVISEMEIDNIHGNLSLQRILFIVHTIIKNMKAVTKPLITIMQRNLHGSQILTLLCDILDSKIADEAKDYLKVLLSLSAEPYLRTLDLWLQKGAINDPKGEFFIQDTEEHKFRKLPNPNTLDYLEQRFVIKYDCIPPFLADMATQILNAGKYINVLSTLGKRMPSRKLNLKLRNKHFTTQVLDAYQVASAALLKMILEECNFFLHLRSMKRFLLLCQGDYIKKFIDECDEDLSNHVGLISSAKLDTLLQTILTESSVGNDPNKNLLSCKFCLYDFETQVKIMLSKIRGSGKQVKSDNYKKGLKGYQLLTLNYRTPWPMSIIINDSVLGKYQLIFRLLFYIRFVEHRLSKTWSFQVTEVKDKAYGLRYEIINTIQNLGYYITVDVIEPNWVILFAAIKKADNFDQLLEAHNVYIESIWNNCLIADKVDVVGAFLKICDIGLDFYKIVMSKKEKNHIKANILRLEKQFHEALCTFLKQIRQTNHQISNLAERIDFNHYYEKLLD